MASMPAPGTVTSAVHALAAELTRALTADDDRFRLTGFPHDNWGPATGPAAVRVLGADVLAPFLLRGRPLPAEDAALIQAAVRAYPAPEQPSPTWARREAALLSALAALGVDAEGWEGLATSRTPARLPATGWRALAAELVRLDGATPPFTDPATRAELTPRHLDISRGLVRALLHQDLLSAARLGRWLTLSPLPDDPPLLCPALQFLEIVAADKPRIHLEVTIARLVLTGAFVHTQPGGRLADAPGRPEEDSTS